MTLTYTDIGYLERDYLTDNYATVVRLGALGAQFNAVISASKNACAQTEALITTTSKQRAQLEGELTTTRSAYAQFLAVLNKDEARHAQLIAEISTTINVFSQALAALTTQSHAGAQVEVFARKTQGLVAQIEVVASGEDTAHAQVLGSIVTPFSALSQLEAQVSGTSHEGAQFNSDIVILSEHHAQVEAQIEGTHDVNNAQATAAPIGFSNAPAQALNYLTQPSPLRAQFNGLILGTATELHGEFFATNMPHLQCGAYLVEPYLQNSYLVAKYCVLFRSQFSGNIEGVVRSGAQISAELTKATHNGAQTEGEIFSQTILGAQFEGVLLNTTELASQTEGHITTVRRALAQFRAIISSTYATHAQLSVNILRELNAQFRAALYNANNLRILLDFASRGNGTNWNANTTATGDFSVLNLNTDIVEQVWRGGTGFKTGVRLTCDTGIPQGVFLDTLGVLNHNLTTGAIVFLQGSNDAFVSTPFSIRLGITRENFYYIAQELPTTGYRYWRLAIDDASNANPYLEIGTVVFGQSSIFQGECFSNPIQLSRIHFKDEVFTEGFTNVSNDRGVKRAIALDFKSLDFTGGNYANLVEIFEVARTNLKCLWIPTPQYSSRYAVFGKLKELPREEHLDNGEDHNYVSLSVEVDESL